ncbi:hypothetical protein, partial [Heyndrickxia coagulans]|uniref:hypothetical protein n=1 Tax=Heyndrickxia coagulans TaxID=1398 RepID=UPI00214D4CCA
RRRRSIQKLKELYKNKQNYVHIYKKGLARHIPSFSSKNLLYEDSKKLQEPPAQQERRPQVRNYTKKSPSVRQLKNPT